MLGVHRGAARGDARRARAAARTRCASGCVEPAVELARVPGTALFEWTGPRSSITTPYRDSLRVAATAVGTKHYDPYSFPLEIDDRRSRTIRGRQPHPCASVPGRARAHDRRRARHPLRRLGAERRARQRRRPVQSLGRALSPDERARQLRRLGAVRARARRRRALQVRDLHARQPRAQAQDRSLRRRVRESARHGEHRHGAFDVPLERCRVARAARAARLAQGADVDLRAALGIVAAQRRRAIS